MEDDLRKQDEDGFRVGQLRAEVMLLDISDAHGADKDGSDDRNEHPTHADNASGLDVLE